MKKLFQKSSKSNLSNKNAKFNKRYKVTNYKYLWLVFSFAFFAVAGFGIVTNNNQSSIGSSNASAQEPADINNDNKVDIFDLSTLLSKWNSSDALSDLNKDNIVSIFDLSILLSKWGVVGNNSVNPLSSLPKITWYGGPDYWKQFPDAVKAGWDKDTFFPIGAWWATWSSASEVRWDKDHGINFYTEGNADQDACILKSVGGMYWIGGANSIRNLSSCGDTVWPGVFQEDEVDGRYPEAEGKLLLADNRDAFRQQFPNKFIYNNFASMIIQYFYADSFGEGYVNGDAGGAYQDMTSLDDYLSSAAGHCSRTDDHWWFHIGPSPLDRSHCRDPQGYGKQVDAMKLRDEVDGKLQPLAAFLDSYHSPDVQSTPVTPAYLKASAFSNIVHGAGFLVWFNTSFDSNCWAGNVLRQAQYGQTCLQANVTAIGEINNQVKSWAPIINTQSYEYAFASNVETALKWYNGSAYIFAMTDGGTGSRTFTLPSGLANVSSVTETISGRTISASSGKFTDNFSANTDYRLYKITP